MRTEEEEGLKLVEERLGAEKSYCLFVFLVSCVCLCQDMRKRKEGRKLLFICLFLFVIVLCVCQDMRKRKD